jgi:hypothetical protein
MNAPEEDRKPVSELDYAPPWAREQAARDQTEHDQFRAALRHGGEAAVEKRARNDPASRTYGDDRPWHQRALEPELVPEPPAGVSNLWPMMLRMGAVCTIAAMVAAAVVFLFSPKPTVHKLAQADVLTPTSADDDSAPTSIESSRGVPTDAPAGVQAGVPAGVPALAVETSAGTTARPPPAPQLPQTQLAAATPPQLTQGKVVSAPSAKPETPAETTAPAQQIASLPAPSSSPANIGSSTGGNEPAPRPLDPTAIDPKPAANPAPSPAPAQTAPVQAVPGQSVPAQAAPQSAPKPAVGLDENEISTLTRRGKNLLNDGDFAAARVLFERAANAGSAEAALALGSTYDPNVIKRLGAIMVQPDIERARKWYQFAADRGSAAASLQLANLPQSR